MATRARRTTVTPLQAQAWLVASKTVNRQERQGHVLFLAEQMAAGQWADNGTTIVFDTGGNILDGHHRLKACLLAGVPFETLIVFDAEPAVMPTIDTGEIRTRADGLAMAGEHNAKELAAAAKLVWLAEEGRLSQIGVSAKEVGFSNVRCREVVDRHPGLRAAVVAGAASYKQFRPVPKSAWSFLHYWLPRVRVDAAKAAEFLARLGDGANLAPESAVSRLRERLINNQMSHLKLGDRDRFALILKGWRCFVSGQTFGSGKAFRWSPDQEAFPDPDPAAKAA